jgi:hypothetical protein
MLTSNNMYCNSPQAKLAVAYGRTAASFCLEHPHRRAAAGRSSFAAAAVVCFGASFSPCFGRLRFFAVSIAPLTIG